MRSGIAAVRLGLAVLAAARRARGLGGRKATRKADHAALALLEQRGVTKEELVRSQETRGPSEEDRAFRFLWNCIRASVPRAYGGLERYWPVPCYVLTKRFTLALPAPPLSLGFPTLPVLDVEMVLSRLPAESRARVAWAKMPIKNGLARLRTEPLTDELVAKVADDTWKPVASLGLVFWELVGSNVDEWRARFVDDYNEEERQLAEFVEDEDSRDTLRWVLGLLQSFLGLALSVPHEFIAQIDGTAVAQLSADEELKPYIRAGVALMAAAETRKMRGDPQRARDLLDVAFLELNRFRATLRKSGLSLTPFPLETVEERRRGLLESADRLRRTLSDEDWRILEQARIRDLR